MADGWNLEFTLHFMERTHEPLHLVQRNFVQWKIADIPISLIDLLNMAMNSS
jgi:hypothetical protein